MAIRNFSYNYKPKNTFEWKKKHNRAGKYQAMYLDYEWIKKARVFKKGKQCVRCGSEYKLVVDHITSHRGDKELFWGEDNWQVLCSDCHNKKTAREDRPNRPKQSWRSRGEGV